MSEENKPDIEKIQVTDEMEAEINRKEGIIKIVKEKEVSGEDNRDLLELFSEESGIPVFKGVIKHAYESDYLGYKHMCPRCDERTEKMMSNFAYGTQDKSRIIAAPAGHFCPNCPTVIIDDDIIRASINENIGYCGVYQIETGYETEKKLFETLNGERPIFILDPSKTQVYGIQQSVHQSPDDYIKFISVSGETQKQINLRQQKKKKSNKRKNKAAKKARKSNRRR